MSVPQDLLCQVDRYRKLKKLEDAERRYYGKLQKEMITPQTPVSNNETKINPDNQSPETNSDNRKGKAVKDKKNKASKKQKKRDALSTSSDEKGSEDMSISAQIEKARNHIKDSLQCMENIVSVTAIPAGQDVLDRLSKLEKENTNLRNETVNLKKLVAGLEGRLKKLEKPDQKPQTPKPASTKQQEKPEIKKELTNDEEDDDVDLFGSDSEDDTQAQKLREQRVAEYSAKKSKKPALIAKSNIILDVKPWDDETDMKLMEVKVREISIDGMIWGASKLVPLAYGIHKLQISCVVEDEKVSVDHLQESIEEIEDYVQSVDIAAFNKV